MQPVNMNHQQRPQQQQQQMMHPRGIPGQVYRYIVPKLSEQNAQLHQQPQPQRQMQLQYRNFVVPQNTSQNNLPMVVDSQTFRIPAILSNRIANILHVQGTPVYHPTQPFQQSQQVSKNCLSLKQKSYFFLIKGSSCIINGQPANGKRKSNTAMATQPDLWPL